MIGSEFNLRAEQATDGERSTRKSQQTVCNVVGAALVEVVKLAAGALQVSNCDARIFRFQCSYALSTDLMPEGICCDLRA